MHEGRLAGHGYFRVMGYYSLSFAYFLHQAHYLVPSQTAMADAQRCTRVRPWPRV